MSKSQTRKDAIDEVLARAITATPSEAWAKLCSELGFMTHPEASPPRFKRLLEAISRASNP